MTDDIITLHVQESSLLGTLSDAQSRFDETERNIRWYNEELALAEKMLIDWQKKVATIKD